MHAKALQSLATCLPISNNLCGKLVPSVVLPIIFDDSLTVTFSPFLQPLLIYRVENLITLGLHCYLESIYANIISIQDKRL